MRRLAAVEMAHTVVMPELPLRLLRLERDTVVHLHIAQAFAPESVWAAHRLRGVPYVAHLHLDAGASGLAGGLLKLYKPTVLRRVLLDAGVVVVFTAEQAESVVTTYGVEPSKMRVVPNGVDASFFHPTRQLPMERRPRLLFVGRLSVQKNLPQLLDALEGVSEKFDTVLVGTGELETELRTRVAQLQLVNVTFAGRADGDALRSRYAEADVFVLPSEREGMPLVLLEALAMALPTVATDIPGTRDVIDDLLGTLVPLGDAAALRAALIEISSDPAAYARMSAAARTRSETYSWETVADQFELLYAEVAAAQA